MPRDCLFDGAQMKLLKATNTDKIWRSCSYPTDYARTRRAANSSHVLNRLALNLRMNASHRRKLLGKYLTSARRRSHVRGGGRQNCGRIFCPKIMIDLYRALEQTLKI